MLGELREKKTHEGQEYPLARCLKKGDLVTSG
jgi:hypothetical protein